MPQPSTENAPPPSDQRNVPSTSQLPRLGTWWIKGLIVLGLAIIWVLCLAQPALGNFDQLRG